jgi:high affinity choline transporter 7
MAAFVVSFVVRVGGGEPLLGVPPLLHYPDTFPFRIAAAAAGLVLLPLVSRATAGWDPAQPLRNMAIPEREGFPSTGLRAGSRAS